MDIALVGIGAFVIVATLLPLLRSDRWWIRIFDFPRIQLALIGAATLALYVHRVESFGTGETLFAVALGLCLARLGFVIYPYTPLAREQVQQSRNTGTRVTFMCANVLMTNRRSAQLRHIIDENDPDIVLLVEADARWQREMRDLEQSHRFIVHRPQDNTYGMLLYSRFELLDAQVRFLVEDAVPSIHATARVAPDVEIELYCLHPRPPVPTEDRTSTKRDAELLLVAETIKNSQRPTVVFGDLNDVAWSRTNYMFQDVSGLLDPRIGRGVYNTFHAKYFFLRFPLDHFFHSKDFRVVHFRRLAHFGSDHFPVYLELSYEPDASAVQEDLHPSAAEEDEAQKKIDKARVADDSVRE